MTRRQKKRKPLWLAQLHMWRYLHPSASVTLAHHADTSDETPEGLPRDVGEGERTAAGTSSFEVFERLKRGGTDL